MGWWKAPLQLALLPTLALVGSCEQAGFDCNTVTTIPAAECEALLVVHAATGGGSSSDGSTDSGDASA